MVKQTILIVDDDRAICTSLKLLLNKQGYETLAIHRPSEVIHTVITHEPDLILLDMNFSIETSGKEGMSILREILLARESQAVILMTGWATLQLAVEGMKIGAKDFIAKPWDNKHLLDAIKTAISLNSGKLPRKHILKDGNLPIIIGKNERLMAVLDMASRVAETEAPVLITGESGTGKELIAELVHYLSNRKNKPFVKVNLGGVSTSLFESEMFGHVKGAFTDASSDREGRFRKADTGTIFLDEIGEIPLANQVKLLRVLQEKRYEVLGSSHTRKSDVRIISATNKNLQEMVYNGQFREDLFYRVNLITLELPPLRARKEDIPLLIEHFCKNLAELYELEIFIEEEAKAWLSRQELPGNIRQLKNIVERTVLLSTNKNNIQIKDFQKNYLAETRSNTFLPGLDGGLTIEKMEKTLIEKALQFHNFNISRASQSLGISRNALYRRMEKYNIPYEH